MITAEQYLNIPDTFEVKINNKIHVKVESLAPAWVVMILKRINEYRAGKDKPFVSELVKESQKDGNVNVSEFLSTYLDKVQSEALTINGEEHDREELEIIRLMTVPNHAWKEHKGDFSGYKFSFTVDDMLESFTELQLMRIWEEFWKRNPRFDRKKKIMNPAQ